MQIVEIYYQNSTSVTNVNRFIRPFYGRHNRPAESTNCRIWSDEQPHAVHELSMHPEKSAVWCGLWAGGIIGPFLFKDDRGSYVTVNGERYLTQLAELKLVDMWFHQDGATCHTAGETMDMLWDEFGLCQVVLVYVDKPNTIEALQDNITRVIRGIHAEKLEKLTKNFTFRMDILRRSRG